MATETTSIHGHEIIHLIAAAAPAGITRQALHQAVETRYGKAALFHTCSAFDMTLDGLLQFLFDRDKITETRGLLHANLQNVCSHDDDHDHTH